MMDLKTLSNEELENSLKRLKRNEADATVAILYHLIELEDRGLYRDAGHSSLFDYCHRGLKYSEAAAGRRVSGARVLRERPEIAELLREGKVTLCNIAAASRSIQANQMAVEDIVGKSRREVEMLVAPPAERKPKERVRPIVLAKKAAVSTSRTLVPEKEQREERYEIKFSVTKEVYEEFEEVKAELSNELGADLSIEAVFKKLLKLHKKKIAKRAPFKARVNTRKVPASVKREVKERDRCQCTYVAPDGTRCTEKRYLHLDHIKPAAKGGENTAANLRLLCPLCRIRHNEHYADFRIMPTRGHRGIVTRWIIS